MKKKTGLYEKALALHRALKGKISVEPKARVEGIEDLSLLYSPGVAEPCRRIAVDPKSAYDYTMKGNTVAVVTDGTAVLGLGEIGPLAALPVMEGKALLFKVFGDIDAFPICLDQREPEKIIETVKAIAPVFGGINLEDISAPRSFLIESALQDLGIPVFHDDQHGTAIVVLAALINGTRCVGKEFSDLKVVISGAGAAGTAIAKLLLCSGHEPGSCQRLKEVIVCDRKGIIHKGRSDMNPAKRELASLTNPRGITGDIRKALKGADVLIGVSAGDILSGEEISLMATDPIVFVLANPVPEIAPEEALRAGAAIVATGRSDFPNQVNNVLCFPGIFRGALDARAKRITPGMQLAAAAAIAKEVDTPTKHNIIPSALDHDVTMAVAKAVRDCADLPEAT